MSQSAEDVLNQPEPHWACLMVGGERLSATATECQGLAGLTNYLLELWLKSLFQKRSEAMKAGGP